MNENQFYEFDSAEFLDNEEVIAEYISEAMCESDPRAFLEALRNVVKARSLSFLAKETGIEREKLFAYLREDGNPPYAIVVKILSALNIHLKAMPEKVAN